MEHKHQNIADLGKDTCCLHHIFGFDNQKKQNLLLSDSSTLVYASSTAVVFENLDKIEKQYILSLDENGVGCITIHQNRYGIRHFLFSTVLIFVISSINLLFVSFTQIKICF